MLHKPPARRSASTLRPPRRTRHPRLSLTVGDLPPGRVMACEEVAPGHWLVTIRQGACYGQVAYAYAYASAIPRWIGDRVYAVHGVINPAVDPDAYRTTCWWHEEQTMDIEAVMGAEQFSEEQGGVLLTPWHHDWLTPDTAPTWAF